MDKALFALPSLPPLRILRDGMALRTLRAEVQRLRATVDRRDRQIADLEEQVSDGFALGYRLGREDGAG